MFIKQHKRTVLATAISAVLAFSAATSAQAATFEADVNGYYRASAYGIQNKDVKA